MEIPTWKAFGEIDGRLSEAVDFQFAFNTEPILYRTEHMQSLFCLKSLFVLSIWFDHDCSFVAQNLNCIARAS